MKSFLKLVPVLLVLAFGAVATTSAMAQHSGRGGGGHVGGYGHGGYGHGWGGGARWGVSIGLPLYWPGYYPGYYPYAYPYAYAYPGPDYAYPGPAIPPLAGYVEPSVPQAAPSPSGADWYFCAGSNAYYPYVRECPGGWQRVPSTPPR